MRIAEKSKLFTFFQERAIAYSQVFGGKTTFTHTVVEDLKKFCRATESTFHKDPHTAAYLEGRRDVWLRIEEFLTLNAEQLLEKHTRPVNMTEPNHEKYGE